MVNYCIVSDRRKRLGPTYYVNQSANRFTRKEERGVFTAQRVIAVFTGLPSGEPDHEWRIETNE